MQRSSISLFVPNLGHGTSLRDTLRSIEGTNRVDLSGVRGGSLAPFLVRYQAKHNAPIVLITPDEQRARHHAFDLRHHVATEYGAPGDSVLLFSPYDTSPYSELSAERQNALLRSAILFRTACQSDWRFLIISITSLARRVAPKVHFLQGCSRLSPDDRLDRDAFVNTLTLGKYYRCSLVEEPGTFAARGSLIDVFPPYLENPLRIDLFGSIIDNIRAFDPTTQKSTDTLSSVWIHPCRLNFRPKGREVELEIADRIRTICDQVDQPTSRTVHLIDDILGNRPVLGVDRFTPAFYEHQETLFDYFPSHVHFCEVDPDSIDAAHRKQTLSLKREYDAQIADGRPAFLPERHTLPRAEYVSHLNAKPIVRIHSIELFRPDSSSELLTIDLGTSSTASLFEHLRTQLATEKSFEILTIFTKYLTKLIRRGYRVAVVTHTKGQATRLEGMLRARGLTSSKGCTPFQLTRPGLVITHGELMNGCILPADGVAFIAEEEVFGRRTRRVTSRRHSSKATLSDLKNLKPGDLVVHTDHGIGKYEGLIQQQIHGATMDFLLVTYRDGDKLYLPIYRLNQIQKYRGGTLDQRLDKLGGQSFALSKAKAKRATEEMAAKLLDLYAKRQLVTRQAFTDDDEMYREFEASFPFEETEEQAKAIDETMADLDGPTPMDRLVCGDVGFGKTEVAMRAAFRAAINGFQTAVLVPTTVLAQQHYQTFSERFTPYPVNVDSLSRFKSPKANKATILAVKEGRCDVVIGTHRLLSKDVHFKNLGLLIIDEEHRFGVAHKERIRTLRSSVDTLVLTATPIPRTLQMAFGGIRSLSLITTAPEARRPIKTMICHDDPAVIKKAVVHELDRNGQVFYVHNRVRDIGEVFERLQKMLPDARIAVGHGQMNETKLEKIMLDFVAGKFDVLLCTTIIESGLDIPRANTIIIDRADRFGLAQLYQLRGRVGRSNKQAYAYLIVPPLAMLTEEAKQRVDTLTTHTDLGSGFSVATMDLELRGAGNLIGAEQSGNVSAVGLEMFCDLLEKATQSLKGEPITEEIEPEITLDKPGLLPDDYIPEVGQRLQIYKQLASATTEQEVEQIAAELTDRFGPLPEETEDLITGMVAKALCRRLKVSGLEANSRGMSLHLTPDTLISPDAIVDIIRKSSGRVKLTPELVVKTQFGISDKVGAKGAIHFLHRIQAYDNNLSIS